MRRLDDKDHTELAFIEKLLEESNIKLFFVNAYPAFILIFSIRI